MLDLIMWVCKDIQPGRLAESLIFLFVLLWRVRPMMNGIRLQVAEAVKELASVKTELASLKTTVAAGFQNGEQRFERLENRVSIVETKQGEIHGGI